MPHVSAFLLKRLFHSAGEHTRLSLGQEFDGRVLPSVLHSVHVPHLGLVFQDTLAVPPSATAQGHQAWALSS